jgi:hypothetical protein
MGRRPPRVDLGRSLRNESCSIALVSIREQQDDRRALRRSVCRRHIDLMKHDTAGNVSTFELRPKRIPTNLANLLVKLVSKAARRRVWGENITPSVDVGDYHVTLGRIGSNPQNVEIAPRWVRRELRRAYSLKKIIIIAPAQEHSPKDHHHDCLHRTKRKRTTH